MLYYISTDIFNLMDFQSWSLRSIFDSLCVTYSNSRILIPSHECSRFLKPRIPEVHTLSLRIHTLLDLWIISLSKHNTKVKPLLTLIPLFSLTSLVNFHKILTICSIPNSFKNSHNALVLLVKVFQKISHEVI
jgi:hypothetical protein